MNRWSGTSLRRFLYHRIQGGIRWLLRLIFRHRTTGLNHVPRTGGVILATNHASHLDVPLVGADLPRPQYTMAKKALHDIPIFGPFIGYFYSFPVRRGGVDRRALRKAREILNEGGLLLMFPEGRRSRDGSLQQARPGVGKLSLETGKPVVPGYIQGSHDAFPPGAVMPRPVRTQVAFGPPLRPDPRRKDSPDRGVYEQFSRRVMEGIRRLRRRFEDPPATG